MTWQKYLLLGTRMLIPIIAGGAIATFRFGVSLWVTAAICAALGALYILFIAFWDRMSAREVLTPPEEGRLTWKKYLLLVLILVISGAIGGTIATVVLGVPLWIVLLTSSVGATLGAASLGLSATSRREFIESLLVGRGALLAFGSAIVGAIAVFSLRGSGLDDRLVFGVVFTAVLVVPPLCTLITLARSKKP